MTDDTGKISDTTTPTPASPLANESEDENQHKSISSWKLYTRRILLSIIGGTAVIIIVPSALVLILTLLSWAGGTISARLPNQHLFHDDTVTPAAWIALFGAVVSSIIGGGAAVLVLHLSRRMDRGKEKHDRLVQERIRLATEVGDFMQEVSSKPAHSVDFDYMNHIDSALRCGYGPRLNRLWPRGRVNNGVMNAINSAVMTFYAASRELGFPTGDTRLFHYNNARFLVLTLAPAISHACYDLAAHEAIDDLEFESNVDFQRRIKDLEIAVSKRPARPDDTALDLNSSD